VPPNFKTEIQRGHVKTTRIAIRGRSRVSIGSGFCSDFVSGIARFANWRIAVAERGRPTPVGRHRLTPPKEALTASSEVVLSSSPSV